MGDKFVAYIDILGFKNMVSNKDTAKSKLQAFQRSIYYLWDKMGFSDSREIKGLAYSDSLLIFTQNDSTDSLKKLLKFIRELYNQSLFNHNIMLRGGLAKGEFENYRAIGFENLIKSQFFGQAFIDAYNLESEEGIKGCRFIFNNSIKEIIDELNTGAEQYPVKDFENLNNKIFDFLWINKVELTSEKLNIFYKIAQKYNWNEHYSRTLDLFCLIAGIDKYEIIKQKISESSRMFGRMCSSV